MPMSSIPGGFEPDVKDAIRMRVLHALHDIESQLDEDTIASADPALAIKKVHHIVNVEGNAGCVIPQEQERL